MQPEPLSHQTPISRAEQPASSTASSAAELGEKAKREATELAHEAGERIHETTESLLGSLADQLESFADRLRREDLSSLIEHARDTAEQSPTIFFAGSVAAGFALSRFMKASEHHGSQKQVAAARAPQTSPPASARSTNLPSSFGGQSTRS